MKDEVAALTHAAAHLGLFAGDEAFVVAVNVDEGFAAD
jgi:hypothetical protein